MKRSGFTFVEVLFVVLITASILMFAVPAFKKAKERSNYQMATGVLADLGHAMLALKQDMKNEGIAIEFVAPGSFSQIKGNETCSYFSANEMVADTFRELSDANKRTCARGALFDLGYMKRFNQTIGKYKFYAVGPAHSTSQDGRVIAYMQTSRTYSTGEEKCYWKAYFHKDGTITREKC